MSADRLHDTRGTIKVTCPHGCGMLIWPGAHDTHCPGIPEWRNPPSGVKLIHATPRQLMEQGAWETARDILGYGQWVFDGGLKSLDCDLILTAAEAREAGYVPPHVPWWRRNGGQLASIGNMGGAFLAAFGVTRIIAHKSFGVPLVIVGALAMLPRWAMLARAIVRRRGLRTARRRASAHGSERHEAR